MDTTKWKASAGLTVTVILLSIFGQTLAYRVGVGRADVTGPVAEVTFMGYAKIDQQGCGLHLRQFARAFVFDDGTNRAAFITVDVCMMNHGVRKGVLEKLKEKFGDTYTKDNLGISGIHTHGAPGGFNMDVMLDFTILGFCKDTYDALVDGIVRAVTRAHNNLVDAKIYVNQGTIDDANLNRSPAAYLYNPQEERDQYSGDTDKDIVQIKFVRNSDSKVIGAINWYAVHPTSMNNSNCLVTSDNVGLASILLETSVEKGLPGQTEFVGAFASTNLGDTTPNLKGPHCLNTGEPCDNVTSTCDGVAKQCVAFGPGKDMFDSTEIIATRIYEKGLELLQGAGTEVTGDVRYIHHFVDMPKQTVDYTLPNGTTVTGSGCLPAMGYSFAAGTIDGVGEFDFSQATNTSNPFWDLIRDFIFPPSAEDVACHAPKPILIMSGGISLPYEWQPEVVATQLFKIGNFFIAIVPGEFTTMSGRRLRNAIKSTIDSNSGPSDAKVVIAGLSNTYTNYIATPEEYQLQRYEAASTIFGPHTLPIYLNIYQQLTTNLLKGSVWDEDSTPYEFPDPDTLLSLIPPVLFDTSGWFFNFGDCLQQPNDSYKINDTVSVTFIAGNPRNDLRTESTFLTVEKQNDADWTVVATDANWDTKFIWRRTNAVKGSSEVEIIWDIKDDVEPGTYRIRHFGSYKYILGGIFPYEGTTKSFKVAS